MLKVLLLSSMAPILASSFFQKTYGERNQWQSQEPLLEYEVDWTTNLLCQGDFEYPIIEEGKHSLITNILPCWEAEKEEFEIVRETTTKSQVLELTTSEKNAGQGYIQYLNLTAGKYTIQFDHIPTEGQNPSLSSFLVFFNGRQVLKIRPSVHQSRRERITVFGEEGKNVLQFVDTNPIKKGKGAMIDNIGIYSWQTNNFQLKEVDAVQVGGSVSWSSRLDVNHESYQLLNRKIVKPGYTGAGWCPITYKTLGNWIQVSTQALNIWNSVSIQGWDSNHRITSFKLMYSLDGLTFLDYKNGYEFSGNVGGETVRIDFEKPFHARAIRLIPTGFHPSICFRWRATYLVAS